MRRALEHWQPRFLDWWKEMGPEGSLDYDVYLRTAVSVERDGWAHFRLRKDARVSLEVSFSRRPSPKERSISASTRASLPGRMSPGEHRANLRRIIVTQGDTEPASVEQQRHLGSPVCRSTVPSQSISGQRRGRPAPLGDGLPVASLFRRPGREEAEALLTRRPATATTSHSRCFQREDASISFAFMFTHSDRIVTESSSFARWPSRDSGRWHEPRASC